MDLDVSALKFNPSYTFDCGQAFRWRPVDSQKSIWVGAIGRSVISVTRDRVRIHSQEVHAQHHSDKVLDYFTPEDDLDSILERLPKDEFLSGAIREFPGLRILTQDPWECLVSFVCSINKNIPAIKLAIENLCDRFGDPISSDIGIYHTFPSPEALANAKQSDLLSCKVGFRWKYIKYIAMKIQSGELNLESLRNLSYEDARQAIVSKLSGRTFGVGPKVADCALLFSLHKTNAFPIDVWMSRCIREHYASMLRIEKTVLKKSLTPRTYALLSGTMRLHFGKYAGYAQQYLYMKTRTDSLYSR